MGHDALSPPAESPLLGLPPLEFNLEPLLQEVLEACWRGGVWTKGNLARSHATPIAEAACRRWITVETQLGIYGNKWFITTIGLAQLREHMKQQKGTRSSDRKD